MLLGLDLGTGSAKALLIEASGTVRGEGAASYPVRSPRPGWAESDPREWWEACAEAIWTAVGGRGASVAALGLSGQMHGVVLSDAAGNPRRPAVLWADTRSAGMLARYRELDAGLLERLANPLAAGMAGPTLLWLRDEEPGAYRAARWALQPKDWLRLRLTGEAFSEPSDASATLLYDLEADNWSGPVIEALGLREDLFPPLKSSEASVGTLAREAAVSLGLPAGLPVAAGAGDTAAALLGSGLLEPGPVQLTVGTGAQIFSPRESPVADLRLRTHLYRAAHDHPSGRYYSMAAIQNAGLALEWVLKALGASWEEAYREAFSVPAGAEGVTFLPYLSGERTPHFDSAARGAWAGLGLAHGRAHLLRAAFEGVAFALREGLEALEEAGVQAPEIRLAGGGVLNAPWRSLLADVIGRPLGLLRSSVAPNASARGAALLAGLACGAYASVEETLLIAPEVRETVLPREDGRYEAAYVRYMELYPRLRGM
jgi:xylulokinase